MVVGGLIEVDDRLPSYQGLHELFHIVVPLDEEGLVIEIDREGLYLLEAVEVVVFEHGVHLPVTCFRTCHFVNKLLQIRGTLDVFIL